MDKLDKLIVKILFYALFLLMFFMVAIIFSQVVSRYTIGTSIVWAEEAGRYIFIWMSFLGMAVAIKQGSHIALDILVNILKGVSRKILMLINNGLVFFFGLCLTYGGYKLVAELGVKQKSATLLLPMNVVYSVIPISGLILFYFVLSQTIRILKGQDSQKKEELT